MSKFSESAENLNPSAKSIKQALLIRMAKQAGLRARINAACCDCTYDELAPGTWRMQVENCAIFDCQLFSVRPQSTGVKS